MPGDRASSVRNSRSIHTLIKRLERIRDIFGPSVARERFSIIRNLSGSRILNATDLLLYHDLLCFIRAYPDDPSLEKLAERELRAFGKRVIDYKKLTRDRKGRRLDDSGIEATTTCYQFNFDMTRYLAAKYPKNLRINWDASSIDIWSTMANQMGMLVSPQETDPVDYDDDFDMEVYLDLFGGKKNRIKALLNLYASSGLPPIILRDHWESLGMLIDWDLTKVGSARNLQRVTMNERFYQSEPLRKRAKDLRKELVARPAPLRLCSVADGQKYLDIINEALAVRNRELYPLTFGDPGEVYTVDAGRGARFILYGSLPDHRLAVETNYGALLIRNGIPVGYGVAAMLLDRAEIAINIFPTFRGGESPFFFEQFFRIFYHHFGSRVFVVRAKQMGFGDEEALLSGAFWFYYKLGFRAVNPVVRELAEKQAAKIAADPNYRVPVSIMRKLSKTDVFLTVDPSMMNSYHEISSINLGYRVTSMIGERYLGDRATSTSQSTARMTQILGIKHFNLWTDNEQRSFGRLALLFVQIPGLTKWSRSEKQLLASIMRAKGGKLERKHLLLANQHTKLRTAITALARKRK